MGLLNQWVELRRAAICILLGFAVVVGFALAWSGRRPPLPGEDSFAGWVRVTHGPVPMFLKVLIVAVASWAVATTLFVIQYGFHY